MQWRGRRTSGNVEDRRGMGGGGLATGGGIIGLIVAVVYYLMGGDPSQMGDMGPAPKQQTQQESAAEDTLAQYVSVVLAETEDVWHKLFADNNMQYEEPVLVLFSGTVQSACGNASAASGPFYCPGDHKLYIDLDFYRELRSRFNAGGDFAMAYVIAHEVGHHVQTLLGTSQKVDALRGQLSKAEYNKYSVKLELQADFYAGVWAHYARELMDAGDIEEALNAANAIGDDKLQKESQGYVVPDAFTHGTSKQRMYWFKKGFDTGDLSQGDTFAGEGI